MPDATTNRSFRTLLTLLGVLWALELVDALFLGQQLNSLGIVPRTLPGLKGIVFAPLLHGGFAHLAANSLPLFLLGGLVILRGVRQFALVTAWVWLLGGAGTWLTGGENTLHIGASIIIFGYFGFLVSRGFYEKTLSAILIAVFVAVLYGSMLWGVLPVQAGVSWQGHLFGFLAGIWAARRL